MSDTPNILTAMIRRDKSVVFREHGRRVDFRWNGRWYHAIRVASFTDDMAMLQHGYSPDTDTVIKINFDDFKDAATGAGVVAPVKNDRIRMESVNWRVEERVKEGDDYKLILRKEVAPV